MAISKAPKKGETLFMVREKGYGSSRENKMGPAKVISRGPKYFRVIFEGAYPGNPVDFCVKDCREHTNFGGKDHELFENEESWVTEQKRRKIAIEVSHMMKAFSPYTATMSQLTTLKAALL